MSFDPQKSSSSDSENRFPGGQSFGGSLGDNKSLGNLAQESRKKQLKTARWILIVLGLLQIGLSLFFILNARNLVRQQFDKEVAALRGQGLQIDEVELKKLEDEATGQTQLLNIGGLIGGISFIALGALVFQYPVVCTVTGLVLYIGLVAVFGFITYLSEGDPSVFFKGFIIKILIIVGLFKAIQAALEYQKEARSADVTFGPRS
jgi:hypothetical protein